MESDKTKKPQANLKKQMRRCFMNGKQCIFCGSSDLESKNRTLVFMAMPFRPNLSTSYSWSLKPYIEDQLKNDNIPNHSVKIMRADEYSQIGAITCEKICRPIQNADLVVVDVSLANSNVMYEIGLAIGLEKQIVFVSNDDKGFTLELENFLKPRETDNASKNWRILKYPGVAYLDGKKYSIKDHIISFPATSFVNKSFKILGLCIKTGFPTSIDDIGLKFSEIIDGAMGVALSRIFKAEEKNNPKHDEVFRDRWTAKILDEVGLKEPVSRESNESKYTEVIFHQNEKGEILSFYEQRDKIDKSFCCIIDLGNESPLAYLWLGYCHAKSINVIPVYRLTDHNEDMQQPLLLKSCKKEMDKNSESQFEDLKINQEKHVLAFDIRALWYIDFTQHKTERLADLLQSVFSELIHRDLPRMERNRFWGRLTKQRNVHIFTGAVHNPDLRREMVGDWDQRAVSELVRYLSSTDETVTPILAPPVYSPEYSASKVNGAIENRKLSKDFISNYLKKVEENLKNKDCIIVGSADVNALTEILLAKAYSTNTMSNVFDESNLEFDNSVIAIKPPTPEHNDPNRREKDGDLIKQYRVYSRPANETLNEQLFNFSRGYKIVTDESRILQTAYKSQDVPVTAEDNLTSRLKSLVGEIKESKTNISELNGFLLLSHILIMRNPFLSQEVSGSTIPLIVILNGVSGPGTFALAEILTGGDVISQGENFSVEPLSKAKRSEQLLKTLNECIDKLDHDEKRKAVQGIVWVAISGESSITGNVILFDQRDVHSWGWCPRIKSNPLQNNNEVVWFDNKYAVPDSNPWIF